jgi:uncharacterized protein YunC (DUF1805 family)
MITTSYVTVAGKGMDGACIPTANNGILVIQAPNGLLACKYISIERANQMLDCVAIVEGVETLEEMLTAKVCAVSKVAQKMGIKPGMTGEDAIVKMS